MKIPRLMLVTHHASMQPFAISLESALRGGARWIQFRAPDTAHLQVLAEMEEAQKLCERFGAILSINAAHGTHFDCVHWPQRLVNSPHNRAQTLNGYSVHDIQSAQMACDAGANYLLFGHVFQTPSHSEKPGGLEALRAVCAVSNIPVLAIGGINVQNAKSCLEAGVHGVAVMRSVWQGDVEANVRALLTAVLSASTCR